MTPDDDKPARYSDDANLEPEREHDTHEPEEATPESADPAPKLKALLATDPLFANIGEPDPDALAVVMNGCARHVADYGFDASRIGGRAVLLVTMKFEVDSKGYAEFLRSIRRL